MGYVLREQGQRVQRRRMKGNIHRKAEADLLFRLLVSYKTNSFIRNVFVFPNALVSAEQCVLYCVFTLMSDLEGRQQMAEILFLRLVCSVFADEPT